jgi:hypothetical protein
MDDPRFDALARRLASRRTALGLLGGLAALGTEAATAKRRRKRATARAKPTPPTKCTPTKACAKWCAATFGADTPEAQACTSAATKCTGPCAECGPGCGKPCGKQLCEKQCVSFGTNANCSKCGDACTGDTTCQAGQCKATPLVCSGDTVLCNGACVTLGTNANCSKCGDACTGDTTCQNGQCKVTPLVCSGDTVLCNGACVTLGTNANCGDCDDACTGDTTCQAGQCKATGIFFDCTCWAGAFERICAQGSCDNPFSVCILFCMEAQPGPSAVKVSSCAGIACTL